MKDFSSTSSFLGNVSERPFMAPINIKPRASGFLFGVVCLFQSSVECLGGGVLYYFFYFLSSEFYRQFAQSDCKSSSFMFSKGARCTGDSVEKMDHISFFGFKRVSKQQPGPWALAIYVLLLYRAVWELHVPKVKKECIYSQSNRKKQKNKKVGQTQQDGSWDRLGRLQLCGNKQRQVRSQHKV